MSNAILIGLCGRSGVGKGYVSKLFAQQGIPSVDTDAVYRDMTGPGEQLSPCMQELHERFGDSVLLPDGALNRPALSAIVFNENGSEARADLNRITHKHILRETMRRAQELTDNGAPCVLIDAPLLFESGFDALCCFSVCVTASEETSVRRICERDGITEEAARRRLASQLSSNILTERCRYQISNELLSDTVKEQVNKVAEAILRDIRKDVDA